MLQCLFDAVGPGGVSLLAMDYHHFGQLYLSTLRGISTEFSPSLISPCGEDYWARSRPGNDRGRIFFIFEPSQWAEVSQYYEPLG